MRARSDASEDNDFLREVRNSIGWLFAAEMDSEVLSSLFDRSHFGNGLVVLRVGPIYLQITRDRSILSVDLARSFSLTRSAVLADVIGADEILSVCRGSEYEIPDDFPPKEPRYTDLKALGEWLRENWNAITEALGSKWPEVEPELERRRAEQRAYLTKKYSPSSLI